MPTSALPVRHIIAQNGYSGQFRGDEACDRVAATARRTRAGCGFDLSRCPGALRRSGMAARDKAVGNGPRRPGERRHDSPPGGGPGSAGVATLFPPSRRCRGQAKASRHRGARGGAARATGLPQVALPQLVLELRPARHPPALDQGRPLPGLAGQGRDQARAGGGSAVPDQEGDAALGAADAVAGAGRVEDGLPPGSGRARPPGCPRGPGRARSPRARAAAPSRPGRSAAGRPRGRCRPRGRRWISTPGRNGPNGQVAPAAGEEVGQDQRLNHRALPAPGPPWRSSRRSHPGRGPSPGSRP